MTNTDTSPSTPIQIEFLYFEDCPAHTRALELLNEVIREEGVTADLRIHDVETVEDAERLRFPGSPTIRVAGVDIADSPDLQFGLCCRAYMQSTGKVSPLPPRKNIVTAVRLAMEAR